MPRREAPKNPKIKFLEGNSAEKVNKDIFRQFKIIARGRVASESFHKEKLPHKNSHFP